jgi:hypothetical protein
VNVVAKAMMSSFKGINIQKDFYVLPHTKDLIMIEFDDFDIPPASETDRLSMFTFLHILNAFKATARTKQATNKEIKDVCKVNPIILKFLHAEFPRHTVLDNFICGTMTDMDMAEWIINVGGFHIRGRNDRIPILGRNGASATIKSSLQLEVIHQVR